ncbi:MAG: YihY family inner membrane protein [Geobacteraceae bacterium]|nr:YihY family inner membrane protein [Geobacteraceae bacterium]
MRARRSNDKDLFAFLDRVSRGIRLDEFSPLKRHAVRTLRGMLAVTRNFFEHKCLVRASALSFTTILSLVPFLAVAFAVLKGFGVQNALEPLIIERLTVGSGDVVAKIISYINNTKMASLGAIGLAALIVTAVSLLGTIEEAFNDIWGVEETRSVVRKFSDYLSVLVVGPVLLLAAMSIATSLQSRSLVRWLLETAYFGDALLIFFRMVPFLSICLALVCLYGLVPNTKVKPLSALLGGVLAGSAWIVAQWAYVHFQIGVAKYNAIYGTLAALPVFMVWIYTSWVIVLFGVEVVVAHQNRKTYLHDFEPANLSYATREATALLVLLSVADSFYREKRPWTAESLADEHHLPARTVRKVLSRLVDAEYLVAEEGEQAYYPARDLEHIRIDVFLKDLRCQGEEFPVRRGDAVAEVARDVLSRCDAGIRASLDGVTLKDLVVRSAVSMEETPPGDENARKSGGEPPPAGLLRTSPDDTGTPSPG